MSSQNTIATLPPDEPLELLLVRTDAQRLAHRLPQRASPLRLVELQSDGAVHLRGRELAPSEFRPHAAWLSLEVFTQGLLERFVSLLDGAAGLHWLHTVHAGLDLPVYARLHSRKVRISRSHAQAPAMAEFVLAHVLAVFQEHERIRAAQLEQRWMPHPFRELAASRWLVVGLGHAGLAIARRARACGAVIAGITRRPMHDPVFELVVPPGRMVAELPRSDVVVLACPLTNETRGLVGRPFLAAMKEDAILVNIARGGLVDEAALLEALDAGRPARAILDVTQTEPLPAEHPLWRHERVRLTAHNAYAGSGTPPRNDDLFIENLRRYLAHERLLHEVTAI